MLERRKRAPFVPRPSSSWLTRTSSTRCLVVLLLFFSRLPSYRCFVRTVTTRLDVSLLIPFISFRERQRRLTQQGRLLSSRHDDDDDDSDKWARTGSNENALEDWTSTPTWDSYAFYEDDDDDRGPKGSVDSAAAAARYDLEADAGEAWLDALRDVAAEEVEFMNKENERADALLRMQEAGVDKEIISAALDLEVDDVASNDDGGGHNENDLVGRFREETARSGFGLYVEEEVDKETVESHTTVEFDVETGEPVLSQMVYVDEVTCVGCTLCATIAQCTFFMEDDKGRARVFQQGGDDEETIDTAIDCCPVDCIHHVSYEELARLELERRDQNINNAARLVNTGMGAVFNKGYGGGKAYSGPQDIETVDEEEVREKEKVRIERNKKREVKREMEKNSKSANL